MEIDRFNIRVYGLVFWKNQLLVSDEILKGEYCTKLPGGGLEFGEGLVDCLKREFKEEFKATILTYELFYVTDFFQRSSFRIQDQVISVYYRCTLQNPDQISVTNKPFAFTEFIEREEKQRWVNLSDLDPKAFKFPIDQFVIKKITQGL